MTRRRISGFVLAAALLGLVVGTSAAGSAASATQASASARPAFSATEKISRVNLINGQNVVEDSRTFSVSVSQTSDLRNRQEIDVSWTGAHPTGGIAPQQTSEAASLEEYPVVLMMCRGSASATSGKDVVSPETCWTQTPPERVQINNGYTAFPSYRLDRYATAADRADAVGVPKPLPAACDSIVNNANAQRWVPFVAADGAVYNYGPAYCGSLPPEASLGADATQPSNTTYGVTDLQGRGSDKFVIATAESNASLGCSDTVPCSLVVIPIMGISCDPSGDSLPPADRPETPSDVAAALAECSGTGWYAPGELNAEGPITAAESAESLTFTGQLWWSASNWRNRIMVPLTFALPSNACSSVSSSTDVSIYGSYLLLGATEQWAPHFCLNSKLFTLEHVISGEPEAQGLLAAGTINAAFEADPPPTPFPGHVAQAPTAVTGFAVVFDIVNKYGQQYTTLRLDARLLAKLLTESYPERTEMDTDTALQNPVTHQPNPLNILADPEFQALNPGVASQVSGAALASAATMLVQSSDTDAMWALTSYINDNPEARAWLNGKPDPWGMVVNSNYKGIKLPVTTWPLLDSYEPPAFITDLGGSYACLAGSPWLSLVASPVESMAEISLDLQYDISASDVACSNGTPPILESAGPEDPGATFILGLTSLSDAEQYGLDTAELETQGGSTSDATFTTSAGRSFAAPTDASLRAAVAMMTPDDKTGSWAIPYGTMQTKPAGKSAYPGTMLISTAVPTSGLSKPLARDYGRFLGFAAGAGQRPGYGVGQLPPGYLPMTAANGAAKMLAYTNAAAADVSAQNSKVPTPTGGQTGGKPASSSTPSPSTSTSSTSAGSQSTAAAASSTATPSTSQTLTTTPGPTKTQKIATTADVHSSVSAAILPLVLLLALIGATIAFAVWQLARPMEPK
jgi:hypothetical protein